MPTETLLLPRSVQEAVGLLREHGPETLVLAGGTVAMALVNEGAIFPALALSLHHAGMDGLRRVDGRVEIGATTTFGRLAVSAELPLLAEAARQVGGWAVRNRATIGGNLFVAPPHGDVATALLALDAEVVITSPEGQRTLPLDRFYKGHLEFDLGEAELVSALVVPATSARGVFVKYGRRQAAAPAVVSVAVCLAQDASGVVTQARLALGAAGPHPLRPRGAEAALSGASLSAASIAAAAAAAMDECDPSTDALASAWYRRKMVGVFVRRTLERLQQSTQGESAAL